MRNHKTRTLRLLQVFLAGALAILLMAGLSLLLSRFQALAQPAVDVAAADIHVTKEANTDVAAPGDTLTYTIKVWNNGDGVSAWMTDTLVEELTYVPGSLQKYGPGNVSVADGVITWTYDTFGWGQTTLITFSAKISTEIGYATIVNTAQVTGSGTLVEDSATTMVGQVVNLDANKTVDSSTASPGDVVVYTIQITNNDDNSVSQVRLTDILRPELIHVPHSLQLFGPGSTGFADGTITWTVPTFFGFGQTAIITFSARISPDLSYDGWITNTAQIVASGYQTLTLEPASTYVQQGHPQLEAFKSVYPDWARPGEYLTYTVRVTNIGDGNAETVWLTDELPSLASYVTDSLTATMGSFGEAAGVITWNATLWPAGTLLVPSGTVAITYTVQISPELTENILFSNTAEITGTGTLVQATASARAIYRFYIYMPIIFKRWPPMPYAPILHNIDNPDAGINDYTVSWSHDHSNVSVISYTLEEATNASFTSGVNKYSISHTGIDNEKVFTDKPDGTYYYRVRGYNKYGYGAWSNVGGPVTILTVYYDNFDNPGSGWPTNNTAIKDDKNVIQGYWRRGYNNGQYQFSITDFGNNPWGWFYQPTTLSTFIPPTDKYCVETTTKFVTDAWWANIGLIFGSNDNATTFYALCLSRYVSDTRLNWYLMKNAGLLAHKKFPRGGCSDPDLDYGKIDGGDTSGTYRDGWNRLQVGVDGNKVTVYIGGRYKGQWTMNGLSSMTRVGIVGGDYEVTPVDIRFADFKVTLNADCVP